MVAGAVTAPRLDLLNRDLLEAHVHAIWLSEAKLDLGTTLSELLIVTEEDLRLPLRDNVREKLAEARPKLRALERGKRLLQSIGPDLLQASWYREDWLDDVLSRITATLLRPATAGAVCIEQQFNNVHSKTRLLATTRVSKSIETEQRSSVLRLKRKSHC